MVCTARTSPGGPWRVTCTAFMSATLSPWIVGPSPGEILTASLPGALRGYRFPSRPPGGVVRSETGQASDRAASLPGCRRHSGPPDGCAAHLHQPGLGRGQGPAPAFGEIGVDLGAGEGPDGIDDILRRLVAEDQREAGRGDGPTILVVLGQRSSPAPSPTKRPRRCTAAGRSRSPTCASSRSRVDLTDGDVRPRRCRRHLRPPLVPVLGGRAVGASVGPG